MNINNDYSQLCNASTEASVQTYALDSLFEAIIDNAKSDDERIAALDFGILSIFYLKSSYFDLIDNFVS